MIPVRLRSAFTVKLSQMAEAQTPTALGRRVISESVKLP